MKFNHSRFVTMTGRGFLPDFLRPVHADPSWQKDLAPLPLPEPVKLQSAPLNPGPPRVFLPPPGIVFPMPVPYPTSSYPNPVSQPLFPSASASLSMTQPDVVIESEKQALSDGSIAEVLFPPGKKADLDQAIVASTDKSLIGKLCFLFTEYVDERAMLPVLLF